MPASCLACGHLMHGSLCDTPTVTTLRSGQHVETRCGCESRPMTRDEVIRRLGGDDRPAGDAGEVARLRTKLRRLGAAYRQRRIRDATSVESAWESARVSLLGVTPGSGHLHLMRLERLLGDALPWIEHGRDPCGCGTAGCDHRTRLVARIVAALAGTRKDSGAAGDCDAG